MPFFSSMSDRDLAALAQQTDEISVAAGTVLAREGDLGDEFLVIESGTAEVTRGGASVAKLGAGDFFGEIALIREERRTATGRPHRRMALIVMTGSSFRSLDSSRPEIRGDGVQSARGAAGAGHQIGLQRPAVLTSL